jgi:hypothetical protein
MNYDGDDDFNDRSEFTLSEARWGGRRKLTPTPGGVSSQHMPSQSPFSPK